MRLISLIIDLIRSTKNDIKEYLKPDIIYRPYEPKVLGNKLKGFRE